MFCAITLALPVSAVTVPATSASFAVIATPVLPVKLPVSVLVNFPDAFTPTLPSVAVTLPLFVTVVPFKVASPLAAVTLPPLVRLLLAVKVTSFSVALIVEPFSVSIFFASTLTPLPVKLPVAVLVNFSDAFTPTLPVSAVTVPLFVMFVPFNTAFRFASTVPPFVKVSVAVNVTSVSVAVMLEPASVPIFVALMATEPASNLPVNSFVLLTVTSKFSFPSAFLIARSFLPVTVVSTLSLPAPTFNVVSSNSIPILVLLSCLPFKATSPPCVVEFKVKSLPYFLNLIFP